MKLFDRTEERGFFYTGKLDNRIVEREGLATAIVVELFRQDAENGLFEEYENENSGDDARDLEQAFDTMLLSIVENDNVDGTDFCLAILIACMIKPYVWWEHAVTHLRCIGYHSMASSLEWDDPEEWDD